jgi:valyl-tRNA synthetase
MTEEAGRFKGMDRFACRKAVVEALKAEGLLVKIEPHRHSVGHCYRCKTVVEPNLSRQWFVKAKPWPKRPSKRSKRARPASSPNQWTKTYYEWMYNIRDWCISRQIWWGHQIPAWTCQGCGKMIVAMEAPDVLPGLRQRPGSGNRCAGHLVQLGPVALFHHGLAGADPAAENFYPTSVLVTGFDILFFWVARMMMMGIHFMKEILFGMSTSTPWCATKRARR